MSPFLLSACQVWSGVGSDHRRRFGSGLGGLDHSLSHQVLLAEEASHSPAEAQVITTQEDGKGGAKAGGEA